MAVADAWPPIAAVCVFVCSVQKRRACGVAPGGPWGLLAPATSLPLPACAAASKWALAPSRVLSLGRAGDLDQRCRPAVELQPCQEAAVRELPALSKRTEAAFGERRAMRGVGKTLDRVSRRERSARGVLFELFPGESSRAVPDATGRPPREGDAAPPRPAADRCVRSCARYLGARETAKVRRVAVLRVTGRVAGKAAPPSMMGNLCCDAQRPVLFATVTVSCRQPRADSPARAFDDNGARQKPAAGCRVRRRCGRRCCCRCCCCRRAAGRSSPAVSTTPCAMRFPRRPPTN
eukprot:364082-Chlamydomonas_euryale.AAC.3